MLKLSTRLLKADEGTIHHYHCSNKFLLVDSFALITMITLCFGTPNTQTVQNDWTMHKFVLTLHCKYLDNNAMAAKSDKSIYFDHWCDCIYFIMFPFQPIENNCPQHVIAIFLGQQSSIDNSKQSNLTFVCVVGHWPL